LRVAILSLYDFEEVKGGTEIFVQHLSSAFADSESITFSSSRNEVPGPNLTKFNIEYARMGLAISKHFARLHRREPYDLVICNDVAGVGLKLFTPGVPTIQVFHYTYRGFAEGALRGLPAFAPSRYILPWFEDFSANGKRVVAVSHKTRRELERLYGRSAKVIENAVPMDKFKPLSRSECRERLGIRWTGPIGIFVGRADRTKGFDVVQTLAKKRKDLRILCVTGSEIKDENLIIAKKVPNADMPIYYSAADFLLFPSRYESASYTTIEAMACDLPIVAHRTGLFEDIEEEKVGRILDDVSAESFSNAIDSLLNGGRVETRNLAIRRFSMERFLNDYKMLAREMVDKA